MIKPTSLLTKTVALVGNPNTGLVWSTAVDSPGFDMNEENEFLTRMPVVEAAHVDPVPTRSNLDVDIVPALTSGLGKLGYGREEAGQRIAEAIRTLMTRTLMTQSVEITEQRILQQALCPNGR